MRIVVPLLPRPVRWAGVLTVAGFIFYTSVLTVPADPAPPEVIEAFDLIAAITQFAQDKWQHFVAYGTLGYALAYAVENWGLERWQRCLFTVGVVAMYGVGIEVVQYTTPDRYFAVGDAVANTLGSVLVVPRYLVGPYVEVRTVDELF